MTKRLLLLLLPLLVLLVPLPTRGQAGSRAGLIVQFSDGSVRTSCVAFEGESITSFDLLQRSGLDVIAQTSGNNAAVCKIGGDGCDFPAEPCFCKFGSGQQGLYWAFWRLGAGGWQYASQGAALRRIGNGEVDGWAWGSGNVQSGAQPPIIPFEQICPAAPPPTAVPPTAVPPTPIPTIRPTAPPTARPATAVPTVQPTAPVVASAPTSRPRPSDTSTPISATVTPTQAATASPTVTATPLTPSVTATATLTTQPSSSATPDPTVHAATATPASAVAGRAGSSAGSYLVFGTMLVGLLGVIGLALWRRRR